MDDLRQGVTPAAHDALDWLDSLRDMRGEQPADLLRLFTLANRHSIKATRYPWLNHAQRTELVQAAAALIDLAEAIDAMEPSTDAG